MLKLKKNLCDFLTATVKPEYVEGTIVSLTNYVYNYRGGIYTLRDHQTRFNKDIEFSISILDFDIVENPKPYIWHKREDFDGNPKKYWIIERCEDSFFLIDDKNPEDLTCLMDTTTHFMFVEPWEPETKETDDANS